MAAIDDFVGRPNPVDHYTDGAAVTPSDTVDITHVTRALYVGGNAGAAVTIVVVMQGGQVLTFTKVPAGVTIRVRATRVNATGTDASPNIVALW